MIKFTIQDILGYLFPGIVTALGIVMLVCASSGLMTNGFTSLFPDKAEPDYSRLIWPVFVMLLLISSILGTLVTFCAQEITPAKKIAQVVPDLMIEKLEKRVDQILGKDWRTSKGDKDDDILEEHVTNTFCNLKRVIITGRKWACSFIEWIIVEARFWPSQFCLRSAF